MMRISVLLLALIVAVVAVACSSGDSGDGEATATPMPPLIALRIQELGDPSVNWNNPRAVVATDESLWVLDSGRNRILNLDEEGGVLGILCERDECQFTLDGPLGMDIFGDRLYVANTGAGSVVVLTFEGSVDRTIELPAGSGASRPSDVEIAPGGDFYVSDPANSRVVHLDASGELIDSIETTDPGDPKYRLLEPLGLALDGRGDLYVADVADGRVKRYTSTGRFVEDYLMVGNPEYGDPLDVVVGRDGTVYYTDRNHRGVQVYSEGGRSMGTVGLVDHSRVDSPLALKSPYGLYIKDDLLYVIDQEGALFAFHIEPEYWALRAAR